MRFPMVNTDHNALVATINSQHRKCKKFRSSYPIKRPIESECNKSDKLMRKELRSNVITPRTIQW